MSYSKIKVYARIKPPRSVGSSILHSYEIKPKSKENFFKEVLHLNKSSEKGNGDGCQKYSFAFEKVFHEDASQQQIFELMAKPVVDRVLEGYNGTIMAYGQTGTGKTHCICGSHERNAKGIIPRAFMLTFQHLKQSSKVEDYKICISIMEIYNEESYDLLERRSGDGFSGVRKSGLMGSVSYHTYAGGALPPNLRKYKVSNMTDLNKALEMAYNNRQVAHTPMNNVSSRSHCIFTLHLNQLIKESTALVKSKLHMIDLSGSERIWKTVRRSKSVGGRLDLTNEAKHINLSLHYLEQVIIALSEKDRNHIPYRNSKITNLLRDSLGGNSHTVMIFTLSMELINFEETVSTCRFSQRVSLVKNKMQQIIQYDPQTEISYLRNEVVRLRRLLEDKEFDCELPSVDIVSSDSGIVCKIESSESSSGEQSLKKQEILQKKKDSKKNIASGEKRPDCCSSVAKTDSKLVDDHKCLSNIDNIYQNSIRSCDLLELVRKGYNGHLKTVKRGICVLGRLLDVSEPLINNISNSNLKDSFKSLGITLPLFNPITDEPYSKDDQLEFSKFLSKEVDLKKLYLMNIELCQLLVKEWKVYENIQKNSYIVDDLKSELWDSQNVGDFPDAVKRLEKKIVKNEFRLQKGNKELEELKNERCKWFKKLTKLQKSLVNQFHTEWLPRLHRQEFSSGKNYVHHGDSPASSSYLRHELPKDSDSLCGSQASPTAFSMNYEKDNALFDTVQLKDTPVKKYGLLSELDGRQSKQCLASSCSLTNLGSERVHTMFRESLSDFEGSSYSRPELNNLIFTGDPEIDVEIKKFYNIEV